MPDTIQSADPPVAVPVAVPVLRAAVGIEFFSNGEAKLHTSGAITPDLVAVAARILLQFREQMQQQASQRRIVEPPAGLKIVSR